MQPANKLSHYNKEQFNCISCIHTCWSYYRAITEYNFHTFCPHGLSVDSVHIKYFLPTSNRHQKLYSIFISKLSRGPWCYKYMHNFVSMISPPNDPAPQHHSPDWVVGLPCIAGVSPPLVRNHSTLNSYVWRKCGLLNADRVQAKSRWKNDNHTFHIGFSIRIESALDSL